MVDVLTKNKSCIATCMYLPTYSIVSLFSEIVIYKPFGLSGIKYRFRNR